MRDALKQLQYSMSSTIQNYTDIMFSYMVFYESSCTLVKPECFNFGGLFQCLWHYSPLIRLQKSQFLIFQPRCELLVLKWQLKFFFQECVAYWILEKMVLVISVIEKKVKFKLMHLFFIDFWGQVVTSKALPPSNMSCMNISLDNSFFEGETKVNGPLCTTRNRNVFV